MIYGYIVIECKDSSYLSKGTAGLYYRIKLEKSDIKTINWKNSCITIKNGDISIYDKYNDEIIILKKQIYLLLICEEILIYLNKISQRIWRLAKFIYSLTPGRLSLCRAFLL